MPKNGVPSQRKGGWEMSERERIAQKKSLTV